MNDQEFQQLTANANVPDKELAGLLKLSPSTVDRWKRGVTVPHPLVRSAVARIIGEYHVNHSKGREEKEKS